MPELPDIHVFATNLKKIYVGNKIVKIKVVNGVQLADSQSKLTKTLSGKILKDIYRSGKELRFKFSDDVILGAHLMLTGDLIPFENKNDRKSTIIELYFSNQKALALVDRFKKAYVRLNPEEKKGIDALDSKLNFKYLKEACNRKAAIKNILLDQNIIRGIGNAYSDEILWRCKISPFSVSKAIPDKKLRELVLMIKNVLKTATNKIMKTYPGLVYGEIRDFLSIHSPHKKESPTGSKIKIAKRGMLKTYYTGEQILYK